MTADLPAPVPRNPGPGQPRTDAWIRAAAWLVMITLFVIAFYVSYRHLLTLAERYGEPADTARLFPLAIDGLIIMGSLVMLHCARARLPVPGIAWVALWLGIVATIAGNAAHGIAYGWRGALVSAASAMALILAYHLLMRLVRTIGHHTPAEAPERVVYRDRTVEVPIEIEVRDIPTDRFEAARWAYEDSLAPGRRRVGRRALADRYGLEVREAAEIIAEADRERAAQEPAEPSPNGEAVPAGDDA